MISMFLSYIIKHHPPFISFVANLNVLEEVCDLFHQRDKTSDFTFIVQLSPKQKMKGTPLLSQKAPAFYFLLSFICWKCSQYCQ